MNLKRLKLSLRRDYDDLRFWFISLKRKVWNKRLKLWWYKLWIRRDELHQSLEMDQDAMIEMSDDQISKYRTDLIRRRQTAHNKDKKGFDEFHKK